MMRKIFRQLSNYKLRPGQKCKSSSRQAVPHAGQSYRKEETLRDLCPVRGTSWRAFFMHVCNFSVSYFLVSLSLSAGFAVAQTGVDSRQVLQQYEKALQGESEQPLKCGFAAQALLHAESALERTPLLKTLEDRPVLPLSYITPGGRFEFHYTLTGDSAVSRAATISPPTPDYVYEAGVAAERAYRILVDSLGFAPHASDAGLDGPEFDFYIVNLRNVYGFTNWTFSDQQGRGPAYILFDNDFAGFFSEGLQGLRVTVAHEYFHAVQLNIRYRREDVFFFEISSTWFEDWAYDEVNDYFAYLPRWFNDLSVPLNIFDGWHEYGSAIFMHYLVKRFDKNRLAARNNIVYRLWQRLPAETANNSIKTVLEAAPYSFSLSEAVREFYEWCFFTGARADSVKYFEEGKRYPSINFQQRTFTFTADTSLSRTLQALAANYYRVIRSGQNLEANILTAEPSRWRLTTMVRDNQSGYSLQRGTGQTPLLLNAPAREDTVVVAVVNASLASATASVYDYRLQIRKIGQADLVNVLGKPRPNPFRPNAPNKGMLLIPFQIRARARVEAMVLREDGRIIRQFNFGDLGAGQYFDRPAWDGRDDSGKPVASGVYFFQIVAGDFREVTKFVVIN